MVGHGSTILFAEQRIGEDLLRPRLRDLAQQAETPSSRSYLRVRGGVAQLHDAAELPGALLRSQPASAPLNVPPSARALSSVESRLEFEAEWVEEIKRRTRELDEGTAETIPADQVIREALDRLK